MLEANTLLLLRSSSNRVNLDSSNPGTSKHPHMSNRIYETFDSEYGIFLNMQCFVGTQKNRLNETLVLCIQTHIFCKNRTECKIRGE